MKKLMARCLHRWLTLRRKFYLTPAEFQEQADAANLKLAQQRGVLDASILALAKARIKTTATCFEVKLTINRAALETCVGDQAALNIAVHVAREILARHNATKPKPEPKDKP